jgi:putative hydrolase of the HAD superfamily
MLNGEYPTVGLLKHHYASHLLGCAKPDEAIYRAFENEVNCTGRQILFFDDLEENINAARKRNWNAHQIDHTQPTAPQIESILQSCDLLTGPR